MGIKIIKGKVVETKEITYEYSKDDIDEEIKRIDGEIDMHKNEIDRMNKELKKWQDKKTLLLKEVVKK